MVVKTLLIGSGAREHAMAVSLKKSGALVYAVMKNANPGIRALSQIVFLHDELDAPAIVDFAKQNAVDFAVVGPEAPLAAGVSNALEQAGVVCASPSREAAALETSKFFTRDLMRRAQLPCQAPWQVFENSNAVRDFIENASSAVIKPLGLTGGKGVKILGETLATKQDAIAYASELIKKDGRVLVEEKLVGEEFTLQAFVSGGDCTPMPLVQDFKRAFDGDTGPMTGGMGSYSDSSHLLPFVSAKARDDALQAMRATVQELKKRFGWVYRGTLYGQFMLTRDGPRLIEYNARFGDPEAMNVLTLLESNYVELCLQMIDGNAPQAQFTRKASVVKYVVPAGYPDSPQAGKEISVDETKLNQNQRIYYAAVNERDGKIYSTSSRAIGVLALGSSIDEAEKSASAALGAVSGPIYYRRDIASRELIEKKIGKMRALTAL